MMRVKITNVSKPWLWYKGMIGQTYIVEPSLFGYRVECGSNYGEVILKRDCIVLDAQKGDLRPFRRRVM